MEFDRAQKIRQVINEYGEDKFYLSFSGGKDSTILSRFIDIALPGNKIPRVFADTGIEFNDIRKFVLGIAENDDRFCIIHPSVNVRDALERDGYPFKSKDHALKVQMYQKGSKSKRVKEYAKGGGKFNCPKILMYQFTPENKLKISDECCVNMKENPLKSWGNKNGRPIAILGTRRAKGGRRNRLTCLSFKGKNLKAFQPFAPVSDEFEEYLIEKYDIPICRLYHEPFNFDRTGCKGCPFALHLQEELDTLQRFFPNERAQCEIIWKPVYDEYRRLGYRLRKDDGQINMFDNKKQGDLGV